MLSVENIHNRKMSTLAKEITLSNKEPGIPEIFMSLQGEGPETGRPSVFIRLSACNLYCFWCDTPYTWNWQNTNNPHQKTKKYQKKDEQTHLSIEQLCQEINQYPCNNIIFTGGEPLLQSRALLATCQLLNQDNSRVIDIETNATIIPDPKLDTFISSYICSPKLANSKVALDQRIKEKTLHWFTNCNKAYFKFVVAEAADFDELEKLVHQFNINKDRVYLMPQALNHTELLSREKFIADKCLAYGYRYSDRLHYRLYGAGRGI